MKKLISLLLALTMIFALCACGRTDAPEESEEPVESEAVSSEPVVSDYDVVAVENHGASLTIASMPEKVVTAGPNCTELMCALGLADKVIGKCMTNHSRGTLESTLYDYVTIPDLNYGYPKLQDLIDSGCDMLIASDWAFTDDFTVEALNAAGITVYVVEAKDYEGIWSDIRNIANIFNVEEKGEELITELSGRISAVEEKLADKSEEPVKCLVYDSVLGAYIYTIGDANLLNFYLGSAGAANVCAGSSEKEWDGMLPQDILALNPDYIIVTDYEGSTYADKVETIKSDPYLSQLDCVKNEKFICMSLENAMPGIRCADTAELIAAAIYPDLF